jgi:chromosome segregation ATPase
MQAQIAKEVELQQALKRERDDALDEVAAIKSTVEKLTQARADATTKQAEAQQALKRERDSALDEVAALKTAVEELQQGLEQAEARTVELSQRLRKVSQSKAQETIRSIGAVLSPFVIAAALVTLGFWTYQVMWSAPETLSPTSEAATESLAAIKEEAQRQAKAAADAEAKLTTAEADQQRLKEEVERRTKAAGDVEAKLKVAETEQQRQAKAAADADSKRRAAETEQQRLKEQLERLTKDAVAKPMQSASPSNRVGQFSLTTGIGVKEGQYSSIPGVSAIEVCSNTCAGDSRCKMFEYSHFYQSCSLFDKSLQSFVTYRNPSSSVGVR